MTRKNIVLVCFDRDDRDVFACSTNEFHNEDKIVDDTSNIVRERTDFSDKFDRHHVMDDSTKSRKSTERNSHGHVEDRIRRHLRVVVDE